MFFGADSSSCCFLSGFAFIEFDNYRDAEDAVRKLDGYVVHLAGCMIILSFLAEKHLDFRVCTVSCSLSSQWFYLQNAVQGTLESSTASVLFFKSSLIVKPLPGAALFLCEHNPLMPSFPICWFLSGVACGAHTRTPMCVCVCYDQVPCLTVNVRTQVPGVEGRGGASSP